MAIEELPIFDPQGKPHLTLVETPPGVPPPEIPIVTIGRGARETWDHVWGWIKNSAGASAGLDKIIADEFTSRVVAITEAYAGQGLHALATVVNDLSDYAYGSFNNAATAFDWTYAHIHALEFNVSVAIAGILSEINNITGNIVPALEHSIANALATAEALIYSAVTDIQNWAVNSIYDPLLEDLGVVDANIRNDVFGLLAAVTDNLTNMINANHADALERLTLVATVAAAAESWVQDCGEPMCQVMGPKTDLGKFLKALQLAGTLALLMEIANMSEADVEARLRELAGDVQHIVGAFESTFVGGGGTLKDFALSLI